MLGEYTLQLNLGCAREADELYPMPEAAVAVGVYRIGHAAAEFQHQRAFIELIQPELFSPRDYDQSGHSER